MGREMYEYGGSDESPRVCLYYNFHTSHSVTVVCMCILNIRIDLHNKYLTKSRSV